MAPAVEVLELVPGSAFERELPAGVPHAFSLALHAGTYLELSVEQLEVDVMLALVGPDGRAIAEIDTPTGDEGAEVLRAVAERTGEHRLEISAPWSDPEGEVGRYLLTLEAVRPASEADRRRSEGDRLFHRGDRLRETGDTASQWEAIELYRQARSVAVELGERLREARTYAREAWIFRKDLDLKSESVEPYLAAISRFRELERFDEEAHAENSLGRVYYDLGEIGQAVASYRRALALWRGLRDAEGEASVINNLALVYAVHGDIGEALTFFEKAVDRLRAFERHRDEARVLNNRGRFYLSIGKERDALDDLIRAAEVAERAEARPEQVTARVLSAEVYQRMGQLETAREMLEDALALQPRMDKDRGIAKSLFSLASLDASAGRTEEAVDRLWEALRLFRSLDARRQVAATLSRLGWLLVESGRAAEALPLLDEALAAYREIDEPAAEALALLSLARARRQLGELHASVELGLRGLDRIEQVRGGAETQDLKSAYFARQQDHYDFVVDLLMELHRREPRAGHHLTALAVSERSRARSLLESLVEPAAGPGAAADRRLVARQRQARDRLAALETELAGDPPAARTAEIEREVRRQLRALDRVHAELRAEQPEPAEAAPRPLTAAEIQRELVDGETVLLAYDLGPERSYLWLVEPADVSVFELPPRSQVDAVARRAHRMLAESHRREAAEPTRLALAALSEIVLTPVADRLRAKRLLVVGEGALLYVPFAVLPLASGSDGTGDGPAPLLSEHQVTQSASASTAALLRVRLAERPPAPRRVAVVADPVFSRGDPRLPRPGGMEAASAVPADPGALPRLVHSSREVDTLRGLLPGGQGLFMTGADASRELVTGGELAPFRIVHFATHGELDSEHPELSRLVLSRWTADGEPANGLLFAHEIHRLDLSADLVVLSACKTALGVEVRGEGLMGLTQSFFAAGAGGVVVSLWQVDDRATSELMSAFYRELLVEGREPSAALRSAQRTIRGRAAWRAPYYWAGFVFQGAD